MDDLKKALKKIPGYNPEVEKKGLDLAHELEKHKVPSEEKLVKEHKHLVEHETDLKQLLKEEPLLDVKDIGIFKPGKGVEKIPRIKKRK